MKSRARARSSAWKCRSTRTKTTCKSAPTARSARRCTARSRSSCRGCTFSPATRRCRARSSTASAASTKSSPATATRISSSGIGCSTAACRSRTNRAAVNYHWHPVPWREQQQKYELAGKSTVRFFRKHPAFDVRLRLGMTPLSLALHDVVERVPAVKTWIENGASVPGLRAHAVVPISLPDRSEGRAAWITRSNVSRAAG